MNWLLLVVFILGISSTSISEDGAGNTSIAFFAAELLALRGILTRIEAALVDCTANEDRTYRSFIERIPREVTTKSPSQAASRMRKRLTSVAAASSETPTVDQSTMDREGFLEHFIDTMSKAETDRIPLRKYLDLTSLSNSKQNGDGIGKALEMMRACVAYHGYCGKAIESVQSLINASSRCRDLSKTKQREFGGQLGHLRDTIRDHMALIGSQKDVMGDLVRQVIAKSKMVSGTPAPSDNSTARSTDSLVGTASGTGDSDSLPEDFVDLEEARAALDDLLTEWDMVASPTAEVSEIGFDSEDEEYVNVSLPSTTTVEPMTSSV
jgi:hypothetical protein